MIVPTRMCRVLHPLNCLGTPLHVPLKVTHLKITQKRGFKDSWLRSVPDPDRLRVEITKNYTVV